MFTETETPSFRGHLNEETGIGPRTLLIWARIGSLMRLRPPDSGAAAAPGFPAD